MKLESTTMATAGMGGVNWEGGSVLDMGTRRGWHKGSPLSKSDTVAIGPNSTEGVQFIII